MKTEKTFLRTTCLRLAAAFLLLLFAIAAASSCGGGGGGGDGGGPSGGGGGGGQTSVNLPKTGQTLIYATGDDGDFKKGVAWPSPRFTDNGNGTVTDNLTGLMWLKNANCINTNYPGFDTDGTAGDGAVTWQNALSFVAGINSGTYLNCGAGYTDWRLPNRKELRSLINYGNYDPYDWLIIQGFSNVQANYYWSSSTYDPYRAAAWRVDFYLAFGGAVVDGIGKTNTSYVWPVRAGGGAVADLPKTGQGRCYDASGNTISCANTGQDGELQKGVAWPSPRFTDNGNGTITDNLTGLMWLKNANCINTNYPGFDTDGTAGDGAVTWQNALSFVAGINSGTYSNCGAGYTGWRLPNVNEIESLIHVGFSEVNCGSSSCSANNQWLNYYGFSNVSGDYWTSTSNANWTGQALLNSSGYEISDNAYTKSYRVWPVRGGQ